MDDSTEEGKDDQNKNDQDAKKKKTTSQKYYQVKWKNNRNQLRGQDLHQLDTLNVSIRNSVKPPNELSICDDRDEIDSIYSELDQSMAIKRH